MFMSWREKLSLTGQLDIPKIRELDPAKVYDEIVDPHLWGEVQRCISWLDENDRRSGQDSGITFGYMGLLLNNLGLGEYVEAEEREKDWNWQLVPKTGFSLQINEIPRKSDADPLQTRVVVRKIPKTQGKGETQARVKRILPK